MKLYDEKFHNKTDNTYLLNGNLVEFVSTDQPQKIRGRKRDYLFANECNELDYDAWMQLLMRTNDKIVVDYNPSEEYHWIYDQVITREDADFYITTYKDNPFLPLGVIEEIERLQQADEQYWKIYGLGQRASSSNTVYTHWKLIDNLPDKGEVIYGQDFGYVHPSALIKVELYEGAIYADEILYQSGLTTDDLIHQYINLEVSRTDKIYADSAEPKTIEQIKRSGYSIVPALKDVWEGIMKIKSMPLYITKSSSNLIKEIKMYKWKESKGIIMEEPVKFKDDIIDSLRYAVYTHLTKPRIPNWA